MGAVRLYCAVFQGQRSSVRCKYGGIFTIEKDYAKELQNKLTAYQELSNDKRTTHLVMVTTNGVARNTHYNMVQNEITMDDLFAV